MPNCTAHNWISQIAKVELEINCSKPTFSKIHVKNLFKGSFLSEASFGQKEWADYQKSSHNHIWLAFLER